LTGYDQPVADAKEDGDDYHAVLKICGIVGGPVSAEVDADASDDDPAGARSPASASTSCEDSDDAGSMKAVKALSAEDDQRDAVLRQTVPRKRGGDVHRPFRRLDDAGMDGGVVADLVTSRGYAFPTQVLAASIRTRCTS
jgi:hypothetical protein